MCSVLIFLSIASVYAQSLAEVRDLSIGTEVTVEGIVTNGASLGDVRYIQDSTGGLALFPGTGSVVGFAEQVGIGDRVRVTGPLFEFNSLLEVSPIMAFEVLSNDNELFPALFINAADLAENVEGQLVEINAVEFNDGGSTFQGNTTYPFNSPGGNGVIYIRSDHPLTGSKIPSQSLTLKGIVGQFRDQYQILPRDIDDFLVGSIQFTSGPSINTINSSSISIEFATNQATSYTIMVLDLDGNTITSLNGALTDNAFSGDVEDLPAATIFNVAIQLNDDSGSSTGLTRLSSTFSNSTGEMEVYFSDSVRFNGDLPEEFRGQEINLAEEMIVQAIENATESVDVAFFNNSTNFVVNALNAAVARGVRVRYVTDEDSFNSILNGSIDFPIQRVASGNALMHHKFIIADPNSEQSSYVITGSANLSLQNFYSDINNIIRIQDQLLARIYTLEIDELWGGKSETPNIDLSKSGAQKTDDTPHELMIGDKLVEVYFSPSDRTTAQIEEALLSADNDISLGLLTLTHNDLGDVLLDKFSVGVNVRAIINNTNDQGTEFDRLTAADVPAETHTFDRIFHHKYGIIDAYAPDSDPLVVTGSHNWTNAAENSNDENTLIIHSADIATIFQSEFEARWCELRPADCLSTRSSQLNLLQNAHLFPNPTRDFIVIESPEWDPGAAVVRLTSLSGVHSRMYASSNIDQSGKLTYNLQQIPTGAYFVEVITQKHRFARTIIKH